MFIFLQFLMFLSSCSLYLTHAKDFGSAQLILPYKYFIYNSLCADKVFISMIQHAMVLNVGTKIGNKGKV